MLKTWPKRIDNCKNKANFKIREKEDSFRINLDKEVKVFFKGVAEFKDSLDKIMNLDSYTAVKQYIHEFISPFDERLTEASNKNDELKMR
jgi:hypothetical protein